MCNAVQPRPALVVRANDIPWRVFRAGGLEHQVARPRVVVPPTVGLRVHRTKLPLPQRIVDPGPEAALLLDHPDFEPELDQDDAALDDVFLHLGAERRKRLCSAGVQNPNTYSTPARLYQLRP